MSTTSVPPTTTSKSFTLPIALVNRLDEVCAERMIGAPLLAARAITEMLDRLESDNLDNPDRMFARLDQRVADLERAVYDENVFLAKGRPVDEA